MNRILKRRARQLYSRNFWRLLMVYLLNTAYFLLVSTLFPLLLRDWLEGMGMGSWGSFLLSAVVQMISMILLAPVGFGVLRYVYLIQKERGPRPREVFYYFTGAGRYGRAVAAGLLQSFPSYLGMLCVSLVDETGPEPTQTALLLLSGVIYCFVLYWSLHICLLPYILVEDEAAGLGHIRKESFRLMRGSCLRYLGLQISFIGWYLLITAAVTVILLAMLVPTILDYAGMGVMLPDSLMETYLLWTELGVYLCMTFLSPYIALAAAAFGDAALQGQLEQLAWQGQAPYGGYPNTTGWQQPGFPPQWQAPPQYPPQHSQGGGRYYGPEPTGWQPPPPQNEPFAAARQEEFSQYQRYRQGQPMEPRVFTSYGSTADPEGFLPWPQVERGDLYSFLKLESWMPGMVAAAWRQAACAMSAQPAASGAVVKRAVTETLNGTRFTVTAILSDDPEAECWQVCIRVELG